MKHFSETKQTLQSKYNKGKIDVYVKTFLLIC